MTDDVVEPNAHLQATGMPPMPRALAARLARYAAYSPVEVVDWHPRRRALLVVRRFGATMQLHLLEQPGAEASPLTDFDDPVTMAAFDPRDGSCLVHSRDTGGDEAAQLHRLDIADRRSTRLTDPGRKHGPAVWNHAGDRIAFESVPLARHGDASPVAVATRITILDPTAPDAPRSVAELPGGGWHVQTWSRDDRTLFVLETRSIDDSRLWAIDAATGQRAQLLPAPSASGRSVACVACAVARDGRHLLCISDEGGEFRRLVVLDPVTGAQRALTADVPWDVVSLATQRGGADDATPERVAAVVNVAGRHELHVYDVASGARVLLAGLPDAARAGSVSRVRFARCGDLDEIALTVDSAASPGDVYTLKLDAGPTARAERWTRQAVDDFDERDVREAAIVRWKSFDGLEISGLISRPPARFAGKRPVLIHIHGGPESQATVGFLGVNRLFVDEWGIAYLQPNVRGSTGYGRTFTALDDGLLREDSVKDIGALLDWIATQPDLDASRVLVAGRSYGGFMSLAVAVAEAERIVATIAVVGISHFTTFLERTESYRRDLRRVEYGDERDPEIRAFFERIAPLSNADRIRRPLCVVAGANDPRVPAAESAQIVDQVRRNGIPVWHVVADNEGHVFARKPNIDFVALAQALFVQTYLQTG